MKVVWITGGGSGIGYACAEAFARSGYSVAITGRDIVKLISAVTKIEAIGTDVIGFTCDMRNEAEVLDAVQTIAASFGAEPHVLVNNAGIAPWSTFSETTTAEFDESMETNVIGYFLATQAVLPKMVEKQDGTIVNILSIASKKAFRNGAAYNAAKFAAIGMTDSLREDVRSKGIRVINVFPGATETDMWGDDERKKFREKMMQPEDIATMILSAVELPKRALVEEIVIRPIGGDL